MSSILNKIFCPRLLTAIVVSVLSMMPGLSAGRYVSVNGDDRSDMSSPSAACKTLGKALENIAAGDTIYILPGKYQVSPEEIKKTYNPGPYAVVYDLCMSGEPGKPIVIKGIADTDGRKPVFDFSDVIYKDKGNPMGYRITGFLISGSFIKISDLDCTGIQVTRTDHTQSENFRISNGCYNTLENIACHDGMGIGIYINNNSHHNLIVNCDSYNNYDPVSDITPKTGVGKGGNNDGFGCHVKEGNDGNVIIGCRAWRNSDDGFDLINCFSPTAISYCIAFENGYDALGEDRADGNGIKGGGFGMKAKDILFPNGNVPRHRICNNFAAHNKANGIYSNHHLGGIDFHRNSSIGNRRSNYSFVNRKGAAKEENQDVNGYGHSLEWNLSVTDKMGKDIMAFDSPVEHNALLCGENTKPVIMEALLAPKLEDGFLSPSTISHINSFMDRGFGANFKDYRTAISDARKSSGADTR